MPHLLNNSETRLNSCYSNVPKTNNVIKNYRHKKGGKKTEKHNSAWYNSMLPVKCMHRNATIVLLTLVWTCSTCKSSCLLLFNILKHKSVHKHV